MHSLVDVIVCLLSCWLFLSLPLNFGWNLRAAISIALFFGVQTVISKCLKLCEEDWTLRKILAGLFGAFAGLLIANMIIVPAHICYGNGSDLGFAISSIISITFASITARACIKFEPQIFKTSILKAATENTHLIKILDSNALIDGRIVKLLETSFLEGIIVIPTIVLDELKKLADNPEEAKRKKGRIGLKTAQSLLERGAIQYECELRGDVDHSILKLAEELNAKTITSDVNMIQLAQTKNMATLSINQLAASLQMSYLKGQLLEVEIMKQGKEPQQGLAYTEDGILIVVEGGSYHVGSVARIQIRSLLQTANGTMLFADIAENL